MSNYLFFIEDVPVSWNGNINTLRKGSMGKVYIISPDGSACQMPRVYCKNEDKELQSLLEKNPDLIPGDQINPDDPRRWLLVKREMPVPDPNTGSDRWNVDFFFVDQDATPTFVECKRFKDTRARREVIGQVFEYVANAHYYWQKDVIASYTEETAKTNGLSLEECLASLQPTNDDTADTFFERVTQNLREGQVRIVFFLEDSPFELRSVVDFLNRQMERSEILLVEARIFDKDGNKIVVPSLFGYTEEARRVKKTVTVTSQASRKKWEEQSFLQDAKTKLGATAFESIEKLYNFCKSTNCQIKWGSGAISGSFGLVCPSICPRSIITVWTNGPLSFNFGWLQGSQEIEIFRDRLKKAIEFTLELLFQENQLSKYPSCPIEVWSPKVDSIIVALKELLDSV